MEYLSSILVTVLLVTLAAIFSGLNISLMSLKLPELKRAAKLGNRHARRVLPLRERAYLSLASILFANVAVVSVSTLNLEAQFNGLIAAIATTVLMVVFGELLPQAIFVRSALRFCSLFAPLIQMVTLLTYPLSKPLALLLDKYVGHEPHRLHTRAELGMLMDEHKIFDGSELDDDEVEIIQGALKLSEKTVKDIMQPIGEVFWLSIDAVLDEATVDTITERGFSRVPIFDEKLDTCHGVLLMKDMVDMDFSAKPVPIRSFVLHRTKLIGSRTALDTMFRKLPSIHSHLFPVEQGGRIIGILTVEDLLEEIIGHEIADETDRLMARE